MKKFYSILSLGAVIGGVLAAGCSKSRDAGLSSTAGNEPITTEPSGPVEMKARWTVGKRYDQEMSMKQNMHMDIPGIPKPIDQKTATVMDFSIAALKDLPEGGVETEMTITGYKVRSEANGNVSLNFDSTQDTQPGDNPASAVLRKMVGGHVKYETDASGMVTKVIGMDEFLAQLSGGDAQAQTLIKGMLNEDTLKQIAMRGQGLPDKPVKIGDHWPIHIDMTTGQAGAITMDMKYTFKGWQHHAGHKCALLEFVGDLATKPGSSGGPMNVSIDKGRVAGHTWFDPEQAMVVETVSDQPMTIKFDVQGKPVSSEMKQTVTIKLTEVADLPK